MGGVSLADLWSDRDTRIATMARAARCKTRLDDWVIMTVEVTGFDLGISYSATKPLPWRLVPWSQYADLTLAGRAIEFDYKGISAVELGVHLDESLSDPGQQARLRDEPMKSVGSLEVRPDRLSIYLSVPHTVFQHACTLALSGKPMWAQLTFAGIKHRKALVTSFSLNTDKSQYE